MKEIKLDSRDLVVHIEEENLDNMELLDAIAAVDDGDPFAMSRLCNHLLGKKEKKALYDALRDEKGRVPTASVGSAVREIFEKLGETGKN